MAISRTYLSLQSLSPEELKEFSVMKELAKKGKSKEEVINGDGAESDVSVTIVLRITITPINLSLYSE